MDVGTSLVQAYLHVNGYFTAADYPLVETGRDQTPRTLTDIDLLAVRFGRADINPDRSRRRHPKVTGPVSIDVDPALGASPERTDMIVAEVKQGRAQVNPGARNRQALAAAIARFGCCAPHEAPGMVKTLLQHGRAQGVDDHMVRMVLFASSGERAPRGWHWVHLDHVFRFLDDYLRREQTRLGHVDLHDPALAWLALLHKCQLALTDERTPT